MAVVYHSCLHVSCTSSTTFGIVGSESTICANKSVNRPTNALMLVTAKKLFIPKQIPSRVVA